ncbi:hypothetical protein ACRPM7_31040, partial [Burkholderia vietnamiensis]|uniref:hypothetical protein n=1 Tax=Burkholderia vietnamiensis TaxID=60552 RepID=UPI001ADC9D03
TARSRRNSSINFSARSNSTEADARTPAAIESSFAAFAANRRILRGFSGYPQRMWITLLKS